MVVNFFDRDHLKPGRFIDGADLVLPLHQAAAEFLVGAHLFLHAAGDLVGRRLHFGDPGLNPVNRHLLLLDRAGNGFDRTQAAAGIFKQNGGPFALFAGEGGDVAGGGGRQLRAVGDLAQGLAGAEGELFSLGDALTGGFDRGGDFPGVAADGFDNAVDILGAGGGAVGQIADLFGDHREPFALLAGAGGDDGGVEGQQFGIGHQFLDDLDNLAHLHRLAGEPQHRLVGAPAFLIDALHFLHGRLDHQQTIPGIGFDRPDRPGTGLGAGADLDHRIADQVEIAGRPLHGAGDLVGPFGHAADAAGQFIDSGGGFQKLGGGVVHGLGHLRQGGGELTGEGGFVLGALGEGLHLAMDGQLLVIHRLDFLAGGPGGSQTIMGLFRQKAA